MGLDEFVMEESSSKARHRAHAADDRGALTSAADGEHIVWAGDAARAPRWSCWDRAASPSAHAQGESVSLAAATDDAAYIAGLLFGATAGTVPKSEAIAALASANEDRLFLYAAWAGRWDDGGFGPAGDADPSQPRHALRLRAQLLAAKITRCAIIDVTRRCGAMLAAAVEAAQQAYRLSASRPRASSRANPDERPAGSAACDGSAAAHAALASAPRALGAGGPSVAPRGTTATGTGGQRGTAGAAGAQQQLVVSVAWRCDAAVSRLRHREPLDPPRSPLRALVLEQGAPAAAANLRH